ncbi:MAG: hypothetical protein JWO33_1476 [Caulobacteraceae bacterium]|nr:hypothetical protein [Caulobacteraceae bacterium]
MLVLLGVAVVVVGFALRFNPLLVVVASAFVTGWFAHLTPLEVLAAFGKAFNDNRLVSLAFLTIPMVGVLERAGLQERARTLIGRLRGLRLAPLLLGYFLFRQVTAAISLLSIAGQAPTIRPILAPMAEAAIAREGAADEASRQTVRAHAAAVDNIAAFFGEDIFVAVGSVLLIVGFAKSSGIAIEPLQLSLWAIPSAIAALLIHGLRLFLLQRRLKRAAA